METGDDSAGAKARAVAKAEEDKGMAEMDMEGDPLGEDARTVGAAKKMAERMADLRKQKGVGATS